MKFEISRVPPDPPKPLLTLTFDHDCGWVLAMALKDAYSHYKQAVQRDEWLKLANDLDAELRRGT